MNYLCKLNIFLSPLFIFLFEYYCIVLSSFLTKFKNVIFFYFMKFFIIISQEKIVIYDRLNQSYQIKNRANEN